MNITEEQVIEFLRARAAASGHAGLQLSAESDLDRSSFAASLPTPNSAFRTYGFGQTIADAITNLLPKMKTPAQIAAELRAQADKIEKEAQQ